jgi:hypothetical protein
MITDRKARHADRPYAILPWPAFFLCELVVANPLNGFTTRKRLNFISNLQFLHQAIARRSRNLRTLQKAGEALVVVAAVVIFCRCGLSR